MDEGRKSAPQAENELNDEEIIDLTEVVPENAEDEIIELTNVMGQPDQAPSAIDQADEAAIPLTNVVATGDQADGTEDEIIELADVVSTPATKAPPLAEDKPVIDLTDTVAPEAELPAVDLEIPIEAAVTAAAAQESAAPLPLTEAQVEAALQRVIEKVYGERIERLLVETIERTIRQEIEKIRSTLLADEENRPG